MSKHVPARESARVHDLTKASWSILEASHVSSSHVNFNQVSRHVQNDIKNVFHIVTNQARAQILQSSNKRP
jgi:hypothetical protein